MILFSVLTSIFDRFLRNGYWLLNLCKVNGAKATKIEFPIIIEGKGNISLGENAILRKNASLKISAQSKLTVGMRGVLDSDVDIRMGGESCLIIKDDFLIEQGSRIFVNGQWAFGNAVKIATNCAIFSREAGCRGNLSIGDSVHIGDSTIIDVSDDIVIGDNVAIGPNCVIYTHDHDYTVIDKPAWKGGLIKNQVRIANGAWVGSGVTILPGVNIGKQAVIGAGSVVTKNVGDRELWGGVPAKLIKRI